jgi:cystathionine beta-synthase
VGAEDVITTAHNRLRNAGFSQLPVMEDERLVGVITEDDIIRFAFGRPALMAEPVRRAMRTQFLKVDKGTSLENLVALLHGDSYVAVTEEGGERFLGLITRSDVLNYLRRLHQKERDEQ